jgi:TRAP-type C4-dicarboxylate transport system permease small subunit
MRIESLTARSMKANESAWERWLVLTNQWLLAALLATMSVLVMGNVLSRYLFAHSFTWVEEITRFMMIWSAFLGSGLALRVGGHIAIDTLAQSLPPGMARWVRSAIVALIAASLLAMLWLGVQYVDFAWEQETPVLAWSYGKVYLAMPVGALLMLLHLALIARAWVRTGEWEKVDGFDPQAL